MQTPRGPAAAARCLLAVLRGGAGKRGGQRTRYSRWWQEGVTIGGGRRGKKGLVLPERGGGGRRVSECGQAGVRRKMAFCLTL
eukprot:355500-Chlamydomonas_euryale.AAC.1